MHSGELVYLPTWVLLLAQFLSNNCIYLYYIHRRQKGKALKSVFSFETFLCNLYVFICEPVSFIAYWKKPVENIAKGNIF